jgi:ubiquinone/menaquinone biosynthesis C-methylase UbiE
LNITYKLAAKFYDLLVAKNDLEFYNDLALKSGNKALELGVGTGRIAIPLARAGLRVFGIDSSVYMLEVAKEKLAKETVSVRRRVTLKKGDMRDFELHQKFQFVYIPASTFGHNVTVGEQRQALACVYRHLEDGE